MGRNCWIAGLALCAGLGPWQSAEAQISGPATVRVVLHDDAGVPVETVDRARQELSRVFRKSNIPFAWIGTDACEGSCLRIRIVSKSLGGKSSNRQVVGIAPGTRELRGKLAYVFYDRILVYSAELGLDASQMLGHVMAHELGHLLLPYGAHSLTGIMRPAWDRPQVNGATSGTLTFTSDQAELIRTRLLASALPIAHARR